jgi:N-acetylated-alpha-linked acidic dipeptidase
MAAASPSLAHLIRKTAQDVPHPTDPGKTLWDARDDKGPFEGTGDEEFMTTYAASELKRHALNTGIEPLGSGSDFTVFLQHLGVSSHTFYQCLWFRSLNTLLLADSKHGPIVRVHTI